MLMGICIHEDEYRNMTDIQRLKLLDEAFFRARMLKARAINYAKRPQILNAHPGEVLDERQLKIVELLEEGMLD